MEFFFAAFLWKKPMVAYAKHVNQDLNFGTDSKEWLTIGKRWYQILYIPKNVDPTKYTLIFRKNISNQLPYLGNVGNGYYWGNLTPVHKETHVHISHNILFIKLDRSNTSNRSKVIKHDKNLSNTISYTALGYPRELFMTMVRNLWVSHSQSFATIIESKLWHHLHTIL